MQVCDAPPLRLNFVKSQTKDTVFAGQDKLKLVTHCHASDRAQTNILQEYSAYQMFRVMSDVGYRVRLVKISYHDTENGLKRDSIVRYGFLIESASELADRVDGKRVKIPGVSLASLNKQQAASAFIFNYMIGNTDWSLIPSKGSDDCCHNVHLFDIDSERFMVPYDFDLSGLVNARYAKPDQSTGAIKVTTRQYRGYCIAPEAVENAIRATAQQKDDILAVIRQVPGLPEKEMGTMEKYLNKFFDKTREVDKFLSLVARRCL